MTGNAATPAVLRTRPTVRRTVDSFLAAARRGPAALLIEGEAGIGKTALWSAILARAHGFRVLSARVTDAESVSAYTALADLLDVVDPAVWADLPDPQRHAVDQLLQHADLDAVTDQRAVAAAFLAVLERLADDGPVLVAIDDLQWLDPSSEHVLAFTARRLVGPVGILGSVRTDADSAGITWLQLPRPDGLSRITLTPLTVNELHAAVTERLRKPLPPPAIGRIHEVSGGNPFYAIELARELDDRTLDAAAFADAELPRTLGEVVRSRLDGFAPQVHEALLAAACMAAPTVDAVARATGTDHDRLVESLETVESRGIITIDGNRIRFTHPLLSRGVYSQATPDERRDMRRRLADVVDEPERRARHLALAATRGDETTLRALDHAAESARMRGAPAAAAELLDLAIHLGGGTPQRRLMAAQHHFDAGDQERAAALLRETIDALPPGELRGAALTQLAAVRLHSTGFGPGIRLLLQARDEVGENSPARVQIQAMLAFSLFNIYEFAESLRMAHRAEADAERLSDPHLISIAVSLRVALEFLTGSGFDAESMQRAVALEDHHTHTPIVLRPSTQQAMLLASLGELDRAREELETIRLRCLQRGEEHDYVYVAGQVVLAALWSGDTATAELVSDDALECARQLGGDTAMFLANCAQVMAAAFTGRTEQVRRVAAEALELGRRIGTYRLTDRVIATLGFLEVSLGDHRAAVDTLAPLLRSFDPDTSPTELPGAAFLPDAIEALVQVGRPAEAEPLIAALKRNGRRVDRPWMLAVAGRGRALVLAARGDLDAAAAAAREALQQHDRVAMPLERGRTLLVLGRIEQRLRRKESASAVLQEALGVFERLPAPLWADRARTELSRARLGPTRSAELTPSERRVAELAASGMKNRDVAAELFISPKTVEAKLARIYRKLGIKSRAELGRHIGRADIPAGMGRE